MIRILLCILLAMPACSSEEIKDFVSRHDTHWTSIECDQDSIPPGKQTSKGKNKKGYYSGALMGNGLIGTNMYKLKSNVYRINVGRSDVTEQREGYDLFKKGRLPIGYFTLATVGNVSEEKMDLSLYDATTSGSFVTDRGSIDFSTYVHSEKDLIVFETKSKSEEKDYVWSFVPFKAISPRAYNRPIPEWYCNAEGKSNPDPHSIEEGGIRFFVQPLAVDTTFTRIAKFYVVAWKELSRGSVRRILATVSFENTEKEALDAARKILDEASAESPASLKRSHEKWWHDFYADASLISIPDSEFERFYLMQYYKFASTARPGKPIVDLMGVWPTFDTPWPAIWVNLNLQLTYSFQTKANLGYLAQPLWDALWLNRDNLTRNVTDIPGQEGWTDSACLPRTSSYDFHSPLSPSLVESNSYEVGNLAWTLFYYYWQCLAYGDLDQMKNRVFPLMKSAVNLFFHIRKTAADGTYSLPPTASPEYCKENVGPNSNYDLANLKQGLTTLLDIDSRCSINDPMVPQWKDFLEKMPPFQYSEKTGFMVSGTKEFLETSHRHYSHLFMIYPYHMLDWNDESEREMANFSISRWQGNQGYSRTGKAAMLASEGLGEEALAQMKVFLKEFVKPNTLYAESGPVIETPFAAASSIQEFFLQDWGDRLRIFYGCPSEWRDASFRRLRAAGAFLISGSRKDGRTAGIEILSEKGGECRIQCDIPSDKLVLKNSRGTKVGFSTLSTNELPGGSLISFPTVEGETYRISSAD